MPEQLESTPIAEHSTAIAEPPEATPVAVPTLKSSSKSMLMPVTHLETQCTSVRTPVPGVRLSRFCLSYCMDYCPNIPSGLSAGLLTGLLHEYQPGPQAWIIVFGDLPKPTGPGPPATCAVALRRSAIGGFGLVSVFRYGQK